MISRRLYLVFAVICYTKSVMSCYYDSDCPGLETCCSDSYCASSCSNSSGGTDGAAVAIIVVVCISAVIGKVIFWVCVWYCCCRRPPDTNIVIQQCPTAPSTVLVSSTSMTPTASQGYSRLSEDNPAQHGYANPGYSPPTGTTLNQGVNVSPANNPPPYSKVIQS